MRFDVGDSEVHDVTYLNAAGVPTDPTTVVFTLTEPDGTVSTPALTHVANSGYYEVEVLYDTAGIWQWEWASTGPGAQVEQGIVVVGGPRDGPAPWIDAHDVFDGTTCASVADADRDLVIADRSAKIASFILWRLSGMQYPGLRIDTVRPCRRSHASYTARADAGWWSTNRPWGVCGCGDPDRCGCSGVSQIRLPGQPRIVGVIEVKVDGIVLDPTAYRLDDWRRLVRIDDDRWPCCQSLDEPTTEDDTWHVRYVYGADPPEAGKQAARDLACELYRGAVGGDCALPKRVTTITRQQVTMTILDPFNFFDKGRTGIYSVDLFLAAVNPQSRQRRGRIASPDVGPYAIRTTPTP